MSFCKTLYYQKSPVFFKFLLSNINIHHILAFCQSNTVAMFKMGSTY